MQGPRVLFVDDDKEILAAMKRTFRKRYIVETAEGPFKALEVLASGKRFGVVVSDMRMPGMNGADFFDKLRQQTPDTVRILLTGYSDISSAVDAVNRGQVFRILMKPCPKQLMADALDDAVRQYRLVTQEKAFIKGTLRATIKVLTDVLALVNKEALDKAARVKKIVLEMAQAQGARDTWRLELAVTLSQLGCVMLPEELLKRMHGTGELSDEQERMLAYHPRVAKELVESIPRLEEVAEIIGYQAKHFDGSGMPEDDVAGTDIPMGARLLRLALDYDTLLTQGLSKNMALTRMKQRDGVYDPDYFDLFETLASSREGFSIMSLLLEELEPGMILDQDVRGENGEQGMERGEMLDEERIDRLHRISEVLDVEPLRVLSTPKDESIVQRLDRDILDAIRRERRVLCGGVAEEGA